MKTTLGMILVLLCVGALAQSHPRLAPIGNGPLSQLAEEFGGQSGDDFGWAVAVSGNAVVVGAPLATGGCAGCGAAYVFTAPGGNWSNLSQVATLTESNGKAGGNFGVSVAISGSTIVVSGTDASTGQGAAYVFVEPASGWTDMTQTAELTVSAEGPLQNGFAVAVGAGVVAVGVPAASSNSGAAYVYAEPSGGWTNMTQTGQLVNTDSGANFEFGLSVGVSGKNIVVGAPNASVGATHQEGAAYLFAEPAQGWTGEVQQTTEFTASDGAKGWSFGFRVSTGSSTVAVGSPQAAVNSNQNQGAVYVFAEPSGGWPPTMVETTKLTGAHGKPGNEFGKSVSLSGNIVVAGAPNIRNFQGAVEVFSNPGSGWQNARQVAEILASDGGSNSEFGSSVAVGGGSRS